jgi:hypothetical protein
MDTFLPYTFDMMVDDMIMMMIVMIFINGWRKQLYHKPTS